MRISSEEELRKHYGWPSGRAAKKDIGNLEKHSINFISKSPFIVLSTFNSQGKADASPRGGDAGFVKVLDNHTIVIPDSKGNNRVDSLVNIVETGSLGILFFIPGINETLRINGKAYITTDTNFIEMFPEMRLSPKSCIVLKIDELFLHCAKAFMRSYLWSDENRISKDDFPTIGRMLNDQLGIVNAQEETHEEMVERYKKDL